MAISLHYRFSLIKFKTQTNKDKTIRTATKDYFD